MQLPFTPRLSPLSHQQHLIEHDALRAAWGLLWEQGVGKTKGIIDNLALLAMTDNVNAAFVLAPNGVHRNWHLEELPKHWPKDAPPMVSFAWDSERASTQRHAYDFSDFMRRTFPSSQPGVRILCMSYDGLMTDAGKKASWDLLRTHRAMYVCDESQRVKTPDAKRTKRVIASSVYAPYRRIASGTPMDTPFDIYSQVRFLDPEFWARELGIGSFAAFKSHFGEWTQVQTNAGRSFPKLNRYRNQEQLTRILKKISHRVTKAEVLDLPPKVYKRLFHELAPRQRTAYEQLKQEAMTLLESGDLVTADMALVLQMRLAQITSGFVRSDDGPVVRFDPNPRAKLLTEVLCDLYGPALIWARFVADCDAAAEASRKAGRRPVIYDGNDPDSAISAFRRGEADDLIGNLSSSMIEGWTLVEAKTSIYYSNSPKLIARLQSEDRNHRIGQRDPVDYIDLLGERTADPKLLDHLNKKRQTAAQVLGDAEWSGDGREILKELINE